MNSKDIERGIINARVNDKNATILVGEILIITIVAGIVSWSWWIGGGVFIGLWILIRKQKAAKIICVILSIFWGMIGYCIGMAFKSIPAASVLAIIAYGIGYNIHSSAVQRFN